MLADDMDKTFCGKCEEKWRQAEELCRVEYRGQPTAMLENCENACGYVGSALFSVYYIPSESRSVQSRLIFSLKRLAERRSCKFAAHVLGEMIRSEASFLCCDVTARKSAVITWIPRSSAAITEYGFDHMERVARRLSEELGIEYLPLLGRTRFACEQKSLSEDERYKNAEDTLYFKGKYHISGRDIILIDDIMTSGASVKRAAKLLIAAGARQVVTAVIAKSESPQDS